MSLPPFIDGIGARMRRRGPALLAILLAILLGGCAAAPWQADSGSRGANGKRLQTRTVPPQAQTMYERAAAAMAAGDLIEAQLRFQEFLLNYPDYAGAHVNLAIILAANDDDESAQASITDALLLDPEHPAALNQLGMLLRRQGKFSAAEAAYLKAVTASPDYALAHYNLGVLNELYLQRLDAALQHYQRYQELGGEDKQVSKWIADLERRISRNQRTANVTE